MATEIEIKIDPNSPGIPDGLTWGTAYLSKQSAQLVEAKDIEASDEIYIFLSRKDGVLSDTTKIDMSSAWKTDTTRRIIFRADTGYEMVKTGWDDTRDTLIVTDDTALTSSAGSNPLNITFEGLQIRSIFNTVFKKTVYMTAGGGNTNENIFSRCRISAEETAPINNIIFSDENETVVYYDCIFEGKFADNTQDAINLDEGTHSFYNCIINNASRDGIDIGVSVTCVIKNLMIMNVVTEIDDHSGSATIDYNMSISGVGSNALTPLSSDWDEEVEDEASGNYTQVITGNGYHAGANNPSGGIYTKDVEKDLFNTGVDGSAYSLGIDETVSSIDLIPIVINHLKQQNIL